MRVPVARRTPADWTHKVWLRQPKTSVLLALCLGLSVPLLMFGGATTLGLSSPFEQIYWAAAARLWAHDGHQQLAEQAATARGMKRLLDLTKASAEELKQLMTSNATLTPEQQLHRSAWSLSNAVQQGRNLSSEELEAVVERFSRMLSNRSDYDKDAAIFVAEQRQLSNAPPSWLPKLLQESAFQSPDLFPHQDPMATDATADLGPADETENNSLAQNPAEDANRELDQGLELAWDGPLTSHSAEDHENIYQDVALAEDMNAGLEAIEPERSVKNLPVARRLKAVPNLA